MEIKLFPRVEDINYEEIKGSNAIVIDILRATSVIVTAMENGAEKVIPVLSIDEAFDIKSKNSSVILGGERKGLKIEGFDMGNSPQEYAREQVEGKTIVITTSNGTRAIRGSMEAKNIFIGSMLNGKAVALDAAALDSIDKEADISIVCAGTLGKFSLDDFLCAGYIIDEILKLKEYKLNDISFLAHYTYMNNKDNLHDFIKNVYHYRYLCSIGHKSNADYCFNRATTDIVPKFKNETITL
jgi:2-phosphosulfolactate phosphatase